MDGMEQIAFTMIAAIGEAKTLIMRAITEARENKISEGKDLLKQANEKLGVAHNEHFGLIQ